MNYTVILPVFAAVIIAMLGYIMVDVDMVREKQIERYKYIAVIENLLDRTKDHEHRIRALESGEK